VATGATVDRVLILKSKRELLLLSGDDVVASYRISLGGQPIGPKQREGDQRTPEGLYVVDYHKPDSAFHRALHVSYPSAEDVSRAQRQQLDPGGLIMVHGLPPRLSFVGRLHRLADWTNGCIAVTNPEIDQIFDLVSDGTPIELRP
jgi:murein L,D-transpeptidase YafK